MWKILFILQSSKTDINVSNATRTGFESANFFISCEIVGVAFKLIISVESGLDEVDVDDDDDNDDEDNDKDERFTPTLSWLLFVLPMCMPLPNPSSPNDCMGSDDKMHRIK